MSTRDGQSGPARNGPFLWVDTTEAGALWDPGNTSWLGTTEIADQNEHRMLLAHHKGVGLRGEGPELSAADADAQLHRSAWGMREEGLRHVAHDPTGTQSVSTHTHSRTHTRAHTHTDLSALTYCEGTALQRTPATCT